MPELGAAKRQCSQFHPDPMREFGIRPGDQPLPGQSEVERRSGLRRPLLSALGKPQARAYGPVRPDLPCLSRMAGRGLRHLSRQYTTQFCQSVHGLPAGCNRPARRRLRGRIPPAAMRRKSDKPARQPLSVHDMSDGDAAQRAAGCLHDVFLRGECRARSEQSQYLHALRTRKGTKSGPHGMRFKIAVPCAIQSTGNQASPRQVAIAEPRRRTGSPHNEPNRS